MKKLGYKSNMGFDEKIMIALVIASESYKKDCSVIFKNFGLTFSQYSVLRTLEGSDNRINTITNVSKLMLVSGANMTGVAKRMEKSGFILRKKDPNDERKTLLELTPRGKKALENIEVEKDGIIAKYLEETSPEQRRELLNMLKAFLKISNR
ncbi:MAG: MarR family transcriptional regulator [Desulfatiglandaceae bacterium]